MSDESSAADSAPDATGGDETGDGDTRELDGDAVRDAEAAIADARRRLAEVPAEIVITNHAMGLYELAAIHLSADQPDLGSASLAIDALAALVDRLGDRLGAEHETLRSALSNMQLVFVQMKSRTAGTADANHDD